MNSLTKALAICLCYSAVALSTLVRGQTEPANAPAPKGARVLNQLIIGESVEAVQSLTPAADAGFVVVSPALQAFNIADLNQRLAAGEKRPIDERLLAAITQVVESFLRQNDYPAALVVVPTQNIADGRVRLIATLGPRAKSLSASEWKIRKINVKGAHWFSEALLREKLRIDQGETIRYAELDKAIGWTNNNPFRRVHVQLDPVPTTGEADLNIAVQDALPLRLVFTADNSGNEFIGRNRYVGSITYANVFGLDHQISYQYITTNLPSIFQAHGLDYRIPLSWRHYLQLSGSYFRAQPELYGGFFAQKGESVSADLRYTVPLRTGQNSLEAYGALTFKQSNNNLMWDPHADNIRVFGTTTDIFQLTLGASAVLRDKRGAWAFGASITASPGGINSRNTTRAFDAGRFGGEDSARVGASASYAFANLSAQRVLSLGHGWDFMSRAVAQFSQANLLPSEQFTIGGAASVRGFNENVFAGDEGFVFSNEIGTPVWKKALPYLSKRRGPLESRLIGFVDMGDTAARRKYGSDPARAALASAGLGIRLSLATNFSLNADYGWQITRLPYPVEDRSRGHIKATLAF
jgi:hemolysin activation/secretion protein